MDHSRNGRLFRDHINPGFLEYRKATDAREAGAVVEWSDAGPNSYRDVSGRKYLDCLGASASLTSDIATQGRQSGKRSTAPAAAAQSDLLDPLRAMLAKTLAMLRTGRTRPQASSAIAARKR